MLFIELRRPNKYGKARENFIHDKVMFDEDFK